MKEERWEEITQAFNVFRTYNGPTVKIPMAEYKQLLFIAIHGAELVKEARDEATQSWLDRYQMRREYETMKARLDELEAAETAQKAIEEVQNG